MTTGTMERLRLVGECLVAVAAVIALVISIVSINKASDTAQDVGDRDRTSTYNREILIPAEARFTATLDAFEQQERADLQTVRPTAVENAMLKLDSANYSRLLSAIRAAKAQLEQTAPAKLVVLAAQANNRYGTEQSCMARLIEGKARNFVAEKQNRMSELDNLRNARENFAVKARRNLVTATRAPVIDVLSPVPTATSSNC